MPDKRARYTGASATGVTLRVELANGEFVYGFHIPQGGELPGEINGVKIPASFRDSLLEQSDNWSVVNRQTAADQKAKASTAADGGKDGE